MHVVSFTQVDSAPGTHQIGDREVPRAELDVMAKRNIPAPVRDPNPVVQLEKSRL